MFAATAAIPVGEIIPPETKEQTSDELIQIISKKITGIQKINDKLKNNTPNIESYRKMLNYVNNAIDALNKIDISKLPKPKVSNAWGQGNSSQNDQYDRKPPPLKDYEFMEDTVLDAAGTTLVKNFIWVNATSNSFKPDELEKTIKKLSTLTLSGPNTWE